MTKSFEQPKKELPPEPVWPGLDTFDPEMVAFVTTLDTELLLCRMHRHMMSTDGVLYKAPQGLYEGANVRVHQCERCDTVRIDFVTSWRQLVFMRKYVYPPNYLFGNGARGHGVSRDLIIFEMSRRAKRKILPTNLKKIVSEIIGDPK